MELYINNLIIETTRKCNMKCKHCLRGASQRISMQLDYINRIFGAIDTIDCITPTGGEPTLAMDVLNHITQCIRYTNCEVNNFYMVTNGKSLRVSAVAKWIYDMSLVCSSNELSSVNFSFDKFHKWDLTNPQQNKQFRNYVNLKEELMYKYDLCDNCGGGFVNKHSDETWNYDFLIKEGRAEDMGTRENNPVPFDVEETDNNIFIAENELYLTCSGWLIAGCNWSYKSMDNRKDIRIAHINDIYTSEDLIFAIKEYNKKFEVPNITDIDDIYKNHVA